MVGHMNTRCATALRGGPKVNLSILNVISSYNNWKILTKFVT